jgi:hypothetical protein
MNPRVAVWMSLAKARRKVAVDKRIRAAVIVGRPPIVHDPFARASVFSLVKEADEVFRAKRDEYLADGWTLGYGTLGRGLLIFHKGDDRVGVTLDKRR